MALIAIRASVTYLLLAVLAACDVHVPSGVPGGDPPGNTAVLYAVYLPDDLVADDSYLYWMNATADGGRVIGGRVMRVAKGGGELRELAAGPDVFGGLAIDNEAVYWIHTAGLDPMAQLMRVDKTGGKLTTLAARLSTRGALAVDAQDVYLTDGFFLKRVSKLGGEPEIVAQLTGLVFGPYTEVVTGGIAVDDQWVYFQDGDSIRAVAKTGGEIITLASGPICGSTPVIVADGYVYWATDCRDVTLFRARASSASDPPVALATYQHHANTNSPILVDFSVASSRIYFSIINVEGPMVNVKSGVNASGIYSVGLNGGDIQMLTGGGSTYGSVVADDANVYFISDFDNGFTVRMVAR